MKMTTGILLLSLLSVNLYGEIGNPLIEIKSTSAYHMELLQLEIKIPGSNKENKLEIDLKAVEGEAGELNRRLSQTFSYNATEDVSEEYSTCHIEVVPFNEGRLAMQVTVQDLENPGHLFTSEVLVLDIIPLPKRTLKKTPFISPFITKSKFFPGEDIGISYVLFYSDIFGDISEIYPLFEGFNVQFVDPREDRLVFVDYESISVTSFPTAIVSSEEPGTLTIPEQNIVIPYIEGYSEITLHSDAIEVEILELPDRGDLGIRDSYAVGRGLDVTVEQFPETVKYGESYSFRITLSGPVSLDRISSLKPFFNLPSHIDEEEALSVKRLIDEELFSIKTFSYQGTSQSLIGYRLKNLSIPFLDVSTGQWYMHETEIQDLLGNFSYWQSIIFIILLLLITSGGLLFIIVEKGRFNLRFVSEKKLKKELTEPEIQVRILQFAELYNLTLREREILNILAEGKATKEIAEKLFISPETIKKHIRNIMNKTETHSRYEIYVLYSQFISKSS